MRATFLGTADGHTRALRSHSGIFLEEGSGSLLLDCGANTAQFLVQKRIDANHPQAIWLSHMHSDHVGQFPMLIQSLWLRARKASLTVYAPSTAIPTLRDYLTKCILFPALVGFPIIWKGIRPQRKIKLPGLTLTAFPTGHLLSLKKQFKAKYPQTCFDCYGAVIESNGERIIYSADLGAPRELLPYLQKPTRTLICELTHFPQESLFTALAQAQPIENTLITHYPDELANRQKSLRKVARECGFRSNIILLRDRKTLPI